MVPSKITLHKKSATLELGYKDNNFILPAVYLRAKSPSAEMKTAPAPDNPDISIREATLVGNYALQLHFDDGHNTGIYSWEYLRQLCIEWKNDQARQIHRQAQAQVAQTKAEKAQPLHIRPAKSEK